MGLNFHAGINQLSYGICGLNLTLELYKLLGPNNLSLWPINPNPSVNTSKEDAQIIEHCINNAKGINYDPDAPSVRLWHQFDLSCHTSRTKRVGWPIFELNKFNELELLHLNSQDQLIVCSEWAKNVIKENNIKVDCARVPLGVNREIFKPIENIENWDVTRFLMIGKREIRKGHDIAHEWFAEAFSNKDNVELWVSWENIFDSENDKKEWHDLYLNSKLGSKIRLVPYQQSPHQLNTLYNSVDCLISLSRAEGWNLPLLEGLSCGRQVIATDYSGHLEFLDGCNSYPIEITEFETAYDGKWFHGQGEWAVLGDSQNEEFIQYVRKIHEQKQNGDNLFNEEGVKTAKLFSWENSAKTLLEAISK